MDFSDMARVLAPALSTYFLDFDSTRNLGRGIAFPLTADVRGGLLAGDQFWRIDLDWLCVYDGTRWITSFTTPIVLVPNRSTIAANTIWDTRVRTDYAVYVEAYAISTSVAATNNGSNFWTIACRGVNLALTTASDCFIPNTSADTAATETDHSGNVAAGNVAPANNAYLRVNAAKTGTPGNMTIAVTVYVRHIVT